MSDSSANSQLYIRGFLFGTLIGGAVGIAAVQYYRKLLGALHKEDKPIGSSLGIQRHDHPVGLQNALDDEILSEQFTRNVQFFGHSGQQSILNAFVVVIGLGGVGSHAAHMLLRAGVGRLRLVDFDQVSLSSLNRHAVATRADVGLPKAKVLEMHFKEIVPETDVEVKVAMFTEASEEELLKGQPDYVLDAIDDIDTKIALLAACTRRGLPVICACGAGAKADPSRVRVTDLSEASLDPLARKVRHQLRVKHGIRSGIPMVLSSEKPRCSLIPVSQLSHDPHELQIIPNFRIRTVPVLGTTPAIFGQTAASWILCQLARQPYIPEPMFLVKGSEFPKLLVRLIEREELVFGNCEGVDLDLYDITFLARDVWRAKSAFADPADTAIEKGLMRHVNDLFFTRWDPNLPPVVSNLILLSGNEADEHDTRGPQHVRVHNEPLHFRIQSTLASVKAAYGYSTQAVALQQISKNA